MSVDITETKRAAEALRRSEMELAHINRVNNHRDRPAWNFFSPRMGKK
jgi:hypothetical protein